MQINQPIIYFSQEKTIMSKYNQIKLNKTNETLRNNAAYYLLHKKGLQKTEKLYHQDFCIQGGLSLHPRQGSIPDVIAVLDPPL